MTAETVEFKRVGMVYRGNRQPVTAVQEFSLTVASGEFVSLIGPSGCGKSTLLKIAAGLINASSGEVRIGDRAVNGPQTDVGIVFQNPVLLDWRTVLDNVMLQIEAHKLPRDIYRQKAIDLLAQVGLGGFENARPYELSGGMSQRVSVCRALVHEPSLLLMDEPFGALDALTRDQMMIDLQKVWMGSRKTVVFITHSVPEAVFLSDRVVIISHRPARIETVVDIDIVRPRRLGTRTTEQFGRYVNEILHVFETMGVLRED